jgi:hypothetical protein
METFGYPPNAAERVLSSGHVLAVHLASMFSAHANHPDSTPSLDPSVSLSPLSTQILDRASAADLCHTIRRRDGRARLAESRLLRSHRLWRLPCMRPYKFTPQT